MHAHKNLGESISETVGESISKTVFVVQYKVFTKQHLAGKMGVKIKKLLIKVPDHKFLILHHQSFLKIHAAFFNSFSCEYSFCEYLKFFL